MFCTHIDIDQLEYKNVSTNRNGGKQVHVSTVPGSTDWKDRIRFQMCESQRENLQTALWGLSTPMPGQASTADRRTLELTIESPALLEWLNKMDEHNITQATQRCQDWFKKSMDRATIAGMYVPLVRPPNKPDGKSTVRVKVKCAEYPTSVFVVEDETAEELTYTKGSPDDLTRNTKILAMVESAGLWFMSRQFGMSLTASELMVWPNKRPSGIDSFSLVGIKCKKIDRESRPTRNEEEENVDVGDPMAE